MVDRIHKLTKPKAHSVFLMTFPNSPPKEFLLDMLMSLRLLKNLMSNSAIEKALIEDTRGNHP